MMMRKGCPRCHGDLFLDRNEGPATLTCLQCGRSFAPVTASASNRIAVAAGDRAA
jgi:transcription elongation factor Elf1